MVYTAVRNDNVQSTCDTVARSLPFVRFVHAGNANSASFCLQLYSYAIPPLWFRWSDPDDAEIGAFSDQFGFSWPPEEARALVSPSPCNPCSRLADFTFRSGGCSPQYADL